MALLAEGPGLGKVSKVQIRLFNWGMFISKTEPPSTKKYEKLSRQVLSQAFLQRICWFLILQIKLDESPNLEISRCFPELELGTLGTLPSARRKNNYQAVQECVLSPTCFEEFWNLKLWNPRFLLKGFIFTFKQFNCGNESILVNWHDN